VTLSPWTAKLCEWQARAVSDVLTRARPDFLATATPAAGKTRFALRSAHRHEQCVLAERINGRKLRHRPWPVKCATRMVSLVYLVYLG
jgi:hypothetical protein